MSPFKEIRTATDEEIGIISGLKKSADELRAEQIFQTMKGDGAGYAVVIIDNETWVDVNKYKTILMKAVQKCFGEQKIHSAIFPRPAGFKSRKEQLPEYKITFSTNKISRKGVKKSE